jgi:hypothetical protein
VTELISLVAFGLFTGLLVLGASLTMLRAVRYHVAQVAPPRLLGRDRDLLAGLAFPFVLILAARALGLQATLATQAWWLLLTSIPPIYGLARYVYFELWVIER